MARQALGTLWVRLTTARPVPAMRRESLRDRGLRRVTIGQTGLPPDLAILCVGLQMGFNEPQPLVNAARYLRIQIGRVLISGRARIIDAVAHSGAERRQRR